MTNIPTSWTIGVLKDYFKNDRIFINKTYQREFIWNNNFKSKLILSILKGYPIGAIVFRETEDSRFEIIDGQQRIITILQFLKENLTKINSALSTAKKFYSLNKVDSEDYIEYLKSTKKENLFKNLEKNINFKSLSPRNKQLFGTFRFTAVGVIPDDENEIASYFRSLQNQDKLRAGEIVLALPNSAFDPYVKKINEIISEMSTDYLIFNNVRREFIKIFINIIGLKEGLLALGSTDKNILQYFEINKSNLKIQDETRTQISSFIIYLKNTLEDFKQKNVHIKLGKGWKRFIKLWLISYFILGVSFECENLTKIHKLYLINKQLALHASSKNEETIKNLLKFDETIIIDDYDESYKIFDLMRGRKTRELVLKNLSTLKRELSR